MSLSSTTTKVSYAGNGVTTAFSFPYYFLVNADLVVVSMDDTTLVETVKTITTHYTVTGAGVGAGGTVTMLVAPATGTTLIIYRDPSVKQDLDIAENDSLPSAEVEKALDKNVMISQRLTEKISRTLQVPEGFDTDAFDLTIPANLADFPNYSLLVNDDGDGFALGSGLDLTSTDPLEFAGPLAGPNGTAALPSFTFSSDLNTGMYRIGADNIGISVGGTKILDINASGLIITGSLTTSDVLLNNGSAAAPTLRFQNDTDCGMYLIAANNVGHAVNGAKVLDISTAGLGVTGTLIVSGATTLATSLTGVVHATAGVISASAVSFSELAALTSANILVGNGSNVATSVAVTGDVTISNAGITAIGALKVTSGMLFGAIPITKITSGTANQIIGANAAANANEYKSLVAGSAGSDFAVDHSANTITFNLPDAGPSSRGAVTTAAQTIPGIKTFSDSIKFATTGGTVTALDYYEEGSFSANFNQNAGAAGSGTTFTVNFVRIGKIVTLQFTNMQTMTAGATSTNFATAAATLAARLRPVTASVNQLVVCKVNGSDSATPAQFNVGTGGAFSLFRDGANVTTFTSGAVSGPYGFSMTYTIQ